MQAGYTEEQKRTFKEQFKLRRKRQLFLAVPFIAAIFLRLWLRENPGVAVAGADPNIFAGVFLAFVIGALAFSFRNWRCPACNSYLGKAISPKFCHRCGVELS
jgi:hypothetical protein